MEIAVHMCDFDGVQRGNYFEEEVIIKTEREAKVRKLKNGMAAGKDEVTGEMINRRSNRVVDWLWRICSMVFSGVVPDD